MNVDRVWNRFVELELLSVDDSSCCCDEKLLVPPMLADRGCVLKSFRLKPSGNMNIESGREEEAKVTIPFGRASSQFFLPRLPRGFALLPPDGSFLSTMGFLSCWTAAMEKRGVPGCYSFSCLQDH